MRKHARFILAAMVAALALSLGISTASALRTIRVNNVSGTVFASSIATWSGNSEPENSVICNITLLRTVSTLIPKRTGVLFGRVVGTAIDRGRSADGSNQEHCRTSGSVVRVEKLFDLRGTHRELGEGILLYDLREAGNDRLWKLIYDGFQGTLPEITGINLHIERALVGIEIEIGGGVRCSEGLWEGNVYGLMTVSRRQIVSVSAVGERNRLRRIRGGFICPAEIGLSGVFNLEPRNLTIDLL